MTMLQPTRYAVKVIGVVAAAPGNVALHVRVHNSLTFNARLHELVATDGTSVSVGIPRPNDVRLPLCEREPRTGMFFAGG